MGVSCVLAFGNKRNNSWFCSWHLNIVWPFLSAVRIKKHKTSSDLWDGLKPRGNRTVNLLFINYININIGSFCTIMCNAGLNISTTNNTQMTQNERFQSHRALTGRLQWWSVLARTEEALYAECSGYYSSMEYSPPSEWNPSASVPWPGFRCLCMNSFCPLQKPCSPLLSVDTALTHEQGWPVSSF